jgi:hypothetical protein
MPWKCRVLAYVFIGLLVVYVINAIDYIHVVRRCTELPKIWSVDYCDGIGKYVISRLSNMWWYVAVLLWPFALLLYLSALFTGPH